MKVAIIGAGNMGSAIARGLAQGYLVQGHEIVEIGRASCRERV